MVVEVFITQSNSENALSQHCFLLMNNEKLISRIGNAAIDGIDKAKLFVNLSHEQCACIGSKTATVEISLDFFVF